MDAAASRQRRLKWIGVFSRRVSDVKTYLIPVQAVNYLPKLKAPLCGGNDINDRGAFYHLSY